MHALPLVIFAGGKSSRMGEDKSLLPFGGYATMTEYHLARLSPFFEKTYIACKSRDKFSFDADFIEDLPRYTDAAPFIGLISVFEQLHAEWIAVLSVDTPFFGADHFRRLLACRTPRNDAVVAKSPRGMQPLCALYRRTLLPHLKALSEAKQYRFYPLFERVDTAFVPFDDEAIFTNLNTPQEYTQACRKA